ncbi:MAG: hypothetical protein U0237_18735 [Thermoleophilia bacterium]
MTEPVKRNRLLVLWEDLPIGVQIAVVLPSAILGLWAVHVWMLGQPTGRGFGYGLFWGLIVGFVIVGSTRAERARRRAGRPPGG